MPKLRICLFCVILCCASMCAAQLQSQFLQASDWANGDGFGTLVAIDGNTAVVVAICAPNDNYSDCNLTGDSAIYVFTRTNNVWTQVAETTCPAPCGNSNYSVQGPSLAINGNVFVLGMPQGNGGLGTAYLYVEPAGGWTNGMAPTGTLLASDAGTYTGFGVSVAISQNTIVVTAAGAAYVYTEPAGGWTTMPQTAELTPVTPDSYFGWGRFASQQAVLVGDNAIVVGEPYQTQQQDDGWVNLFVEPPGGWVNANPTSRINLNLPYCLAASGNNVGVGLADGADGILIYHVSNGVLTEQAQISPPGDQLFWYCPLVMSGPYLFTSEFDGYNHPSNPVFVYREPKTGWVSTNKPIGTLNPWPNSLMNGSSAALAATDILGGALFIGENTATKYRCKSGSCPGSGGAVIYWP